MGTQLQRFAFFLLAILVGALLGVFIGWQIAPVRDTGARPEALRRDYKTDTVLMVAEIYQQEGDLPMAITRLATLGEGPLAGTVRDAIAYGQEIGYDPADLALMLALAEDLDQGQLEAR